MLTDIVHTDKDKQTAGDEDHEYEILDKFHPPKTVSHAPPSKSDQNVEDYELTQCPAYTPVSHGNQLAETLIMAPHSSGHSSGMATTASGGKGQPPGAVDEDNGTYETVCPN